jgi:hypothetical protein
LVKVARVSAVACVLVILALSPARAYAVPIPWKNCGTAADLVHVSLTDASVWPPQRGQPLTLKIMGTLGQDVHFVSGSLNLTYTPPNGPSHHVGFSWHSVQMNLRAGPINVGRTFRVPAFIASGTILAIHFDESVPTTGKGILCVDLTVPIK